MNKKLYRDEYHKVIGGVCSGLADYFEMDVTIVRLLFAFTFFIMGVGLGTYIILWIVLPKRGYPFNAFNNPNVDYTVKPQQPAEDFNTPPNPFTNNPFGDKTYAGSPYSSAPFGNPTGYVPPRQKSNAGVIVGMVLIVVGAAVLIDEFDLIPDFDFERLWPAILVLVGAAIIVSGRKSQPWESKDWHNAGTTPNPPATDEPAATENHD